MASMVDTVGPLAFSLAELESWKKGPLIQHQQKPLGNDGTWHIKQGPIPSYTLSCSRKIVNLCLVNGSQWCTHNNHQYYKNWVILDNLVSMNHDSLVKSTFWLAEDNFGWWNHRKIKIGVPPFHHWILHQKDHQFFKIFGYIPSNISYEWLVTHPHNSWIYHHMEDKLLVWYHFLNVKQVKQSHTHIYI